MQAGRAVGGLVDAAALQIGQNGARRQPQAADSLAAPGVAGRHREADELDGCFLHIVGKGFHDVAAGVDHLQAARRKRQQRPLHRDGEQHDQKHDVEQIAVGRDRADDRHDGEHDGRRPAQARKTDEQPLAHAAAKRRQQRKHRRRAGHQRQKQRNGRRLAQHGRHLRGEGQQPQQEKQHHLHHAGDAVKKRDQRFFVADLAVAQQNAGDVHAQKAVAAQQRRRGVAEQRHPDDEQRIEPAGAKLEPPQQPQRGHAHAKAEQQAEAQLRRQHAQHRPRRDAGFHRRQQHGGEHVGERVVGAALDFQHRVGVFFQRQFARAQDGEHRRRVGRAQHRAAQKAFQQRHAQRQVAERAGQQCGEHGARAGQHDGLHRHRFGRAPVGAETAVKHDEQQRHRRELVGKAIVVERDASDAVGAEQHTQDQKRQQRRHAQAHRQAVERHTDKDDDGQKQQQRRQHGGPPDGFGAKRRGKGRDVSPAAAPEL